MQMLPVLAATETVLVVLLSSLAMDGGKQDKLQVWMIMMWQLHGLMEVILTTTNLVRII